MPLTPEQLVQELPSLRQQLEEADKAWKEADFASLIASAKEGQARSRLDALRQTVQVVEELAAAYAPPDRVSKAADAGLVATSKDGKTILVAEAKNTPRGRAAVRRVLREVGRPLRPKEIVEEVTRRGWVAVDAKDPGSSIRMATRRLAEDGELEVVGGSYRYKIPPQREDPSPQEKLEVFGPD